MADQDIWNALKADRPEAMGGTALGFLTTMVAMEMFPWTKGVARSKNTTRWQTAKSRMGHEALAGTLYGAATPTLSDGEKLAVVSAGLFTGMLSAGAFTAGGKIFELSPETKLNIARRLRLEKMFNSRGILSLAELMDSSGMMKIQGYLENIPWAGMNRRARRQQFRDMTDRFFTKIMPGVHEKLQGKSGQELLDGFSQRLFNLYQRNREKVQYFYDEVARLLDGVPRGAAPEVRLNGFKASARRLLMHERSLPEAVQNADIIQQAERILRGEEHIQWKTAIATLKRLKESSRVENMKAMKGEVTRERYAAVVELEQSLWDDVAKFSDELANVSGRPEGQAILQSLREADENYKRLLLPFYVKDDVAKMVTGGVDWRYDEIVPDFLSLTHPRGTGKVVQATTPTGRTQAVGAQRTDLFGLGREADLGLRADQITEQDFARYIILRESLSEASSSMSKGSPVWNPRINAQAFRNSLAEYSKGWGNVFTKQQQKALEGYVDIIEVAERAFTKENTLGSIFAGTAGVGLVAAGGMSAEEDESALLRSGATILGLLATAKGAKFLLGNPMGHKLALQFRDAMVSAHGVNQPMLENKAVRQVLGKITTAFSKFLANQYPEMMYDVHMGEAKSASEMALIQQMQQSPYGQANPMTQSIMGAPPMMQQENK
jgi:hypothetical protein